MNTFENGRPNAGKELPQRLWRADQNIDASGSPVRPHAAFRPMHQHQSPDPAPAGSGSALAANLLAQRLLASLTPFGRWRNNLSSSWQRSAWENSLSTARRIKRLLDIISSAILLLLLFPLFLLIALLIKLEDGGPVFFTQTRVGKFGQLFTMYKFRSMCMDAEKGLADLLAINQHGDGITFKIKNDPRVTKTGKWLRRLSLDELPQFYNVLIGNMSMVGPRPPLPREVARYSMADRRRLTVIPGITCFWQIGGRSEIDFSRQVQLDVLYIESQSFSGDLKILLKTVPAVLFSKGAY